MEKLTELYNKWHGSMPESAERLAGAGSNRQYYRFTAEDGTTVIGVVGTSRDENHAFVYLAQHFEQRQLPVPQVLAVSDDGLRYLQTDLGSVSLFDAVRGGREAGGRYNLEEQELLKRTIRQLPNIQIRGARELDWQNCYPQPVFDEDSVLFDLNYFKYCFLKPSDLDFNELKLEANFRLFAKDLTSEEYESFMYRDFQARNVMLDAAGNPFFIDYQGGRKGPFYYDIASFLWQASARYSNKLRRELKKIYKETDIVQKLSETYEVDFKVDRAARLYAVLNPMLLNLRTKNTSQIFEYTSNGVSDISWLKQYVMDRLIGVERYLAEIGLLDVLKFDITQCYIDDEPTNNYLLKFTPILFDDFVNSKKKLIILVLVLVSLLLFGSILLVLL